MRRTFCYLLLLMTAVILLPAGVHAEGARIVVNVEDISFGTVIQGGKVEKVFTFSNAGDDILKIERVKSSCGCTAALLSNRDLEPGESGEVRATFDSTRFQGPVVKTIYLYTNDPQRKVVQLHLRGEVKREISVTPRHLTLDAVEPGKETTATITIANVGEKSIAIENVEVTAKEVQVAFTRQELQPGGRAEVVLRIKVPDGKAGLNAYVLIKLSGTLIAEQRVPLAIKIAQ